MEFLWKFVFINENGAGIKKRKAFPFKNKQMGSIINTERNI